MEVRCNVEVNAADEDCCMGSEETDKKSNFLGWRRIRDLLANVPKKYSHGETLTGELVDNYNCINNNLMVDSDTHSTTSESSLCDDTYGDLLDSDWEASTMQPIAELENDAQFEREDWDQELRDACPYDSEDLLEMNRQQNLMYTPNFCEEDSIYKPSCHHAKQALTRHSVWFSQVGQFDDADD